MTCISNADWLVFSEVFITFFYLIKMDEIFFWPLETYPCPKEFKEIANGLLYNKSYSCSPICKYLISGCELERKFGIIW